MASVLFFDKSDMKNLLGLLCVYLNISQFLNSFLFQETLKL